MRPNKPCPRRASAPRGALLALLASSAFGLASCGGGGGGGSSFPNAGQAAGSWTFIRTSETCEPPVLAARLEVVEVAAPDFQVLLGEPGQQFVFDAVKDGDELAFAGISTVGDTTIELFSGDLLLAPSGNSMSGVINGVETVSGDDCYFTDEVQVFRDDGTSSEPVRGGWSFLGEPVLDPGAPCPGDASDADFEIQLLPRRNREFLVYLSATELALQLDGKLTGTRLRVTGSDEIEEGGESGVLTILSGSFLDFDEERQELAGTLRYSTTLPGDDCPHELDVHGLRAPTGVRYLPFLADAWGEQIPMGIDPSDPSNPVVLGPAGMNPNVSNGATVNGFAGVAYGADFHEGTGKILDRRPETLFYATLDEIYSVDLVQRRDGFGEIIEPEPRLVFSSGGEEIDFGLRVFSDVGSLKGVLHFSMGIGSETLVEVARDGSTRVEALPRGLARGVAFDPATGDYQGLYVDAWTTSRLLLARAGDVAEIDSGFTGELSIGEDGSVYYFTYDAVRKYDSTTRAVSTLVDLPGNRLAGPVDGNEFYFGYALSEDTIPDGHVALYRESGGTTDVISADDNAALVDAFSVGRIIVTEHYIVFVYRTETQGIRAYGMPKDGSSLLADITPAVPGLDLRGDLRAVMGDWLYYGHDDGFGYVVSAADGSYWDAPGARFHAAIPDAELHTQKRNEPVAVLYEQDGRLSVIEGASPSASPFDTSYTLDIGVEGILWEVTNHGEHVLLSTYLPGSGGRSLHYANASEPASAVPVTDTPFEVDEPIR